MRLINVHTLELRTFAHSEVPLYAALSHRWGQDEVEYEEFTDPNARSKAGFQKIQNACREVRAWYWDFERKPLNGRAKQHRGELVNWLWVDTCCIDKRNFTEYTKAINSMWAWYKRAAFCIVYLPDVSHFDLRHDTLAALKQSEWFERGWTLQELLAPRTLFFYSNDWQQIGSSGESDLMETVGHASRIPAHYLGSRRIKMKDVAIAKRMSWASRRKTTEPEDLAYCLLGIFEVSMPLMYGEGSRAAFQRLQKTIIERYDDESIFAFTPRRGQDGILATAPRDFAACGNVVKCTRQERPAYSIGNRGLQFYSAAIDIGATMGSGRSRRRYAIDLNCARKISDDTTPVMCTLGLRKKGSRFIRDPEIERAFDAVSAAQADEMLNDRTWKWTPSQRFYIHVSRSGRSRRERETIEEPETVSGIFSKAINWLSRHCPIQALGLRPNPRDRKIFEGRSKLVKRDRSRPASRSLHGEKHRRQRSIPRRSTRNDSRFDRTGHSRTRQAQAREPSSAPSRPLKHREQRPGGSIGRQRPSPWTTETSTSLPNFPFRDQVRDYNTVCETCGRPWREPNQGWNKDEQLNGRQSRSRLRSSRPAQRGDSGYESTHSRRNARGHRHDDGYDSGLSS